MTVPTNEQLAERAKSLGAHTVVRNWLDRHPMPRRTEVAADREQWLDWAASNFLADPEIAQYLEPVRPLPAIHYASSMPTELEAFCDELMSRTDEIGGSCLRLDNGSDIWLHTEGQIRAWVQEAITVWKTNSEAAS